MYSGTSKKYWKSLVPQPDWIEDIHHKDGNTQDIINVLINAAKYNKYQAAREMKAVSQELIGKDDIETLYNVWYFVKSNITYKIDENGKEKIKSPALLFHYGVGDCKSFSLMISGILMNYPQITHSFRFTSYKKNADYQHVYIVANIPNYDREIILDSTIEEFNKEYPYIKKKDIKMTQISHLHGAPAIGRKAKPSIAEAFADGPKRVVDPKILNIDKLSQGELNLELTKASLLIYSNYYGDRTGLYAQSISIIDKARREGLHNFNISSGVVDPKLNDVISAIYTAKERHIQEFKNLNAVLSDIGISGGPTPYNLSSDIIKKCLTDLNIKPFTPNKSNLDFTKYIELNGVAYKITPELNECLNKATLNQWAKNNIFETTNFKKGSHSMLYEFITSSNEKILNEKGLIKEAFHKTNVDAFSYVSGMDRTNVRAYVKNGITYTNASNKFVEIDPDYNIRTLSEGVIFKGQPGIGEPITAAIVAKTLVEIVGALGSLLAAVNALRPSDRTNLLAYSKSLLSESSLASINDMNGQIDDAETLGTIVPIGLALLAGGYLLMKK